MYPKNKTQLLKWFKANIGAELTLERGQKLFELDGSTVISDKLEPALQRIVNKAQTNAVNFTGEELDRKTGKVIKRASIEPTWLWFDQKSAVWTFLDDGFINAKQMFDADLLIDGETKQVKGFDYLKYTFVTKEASNNGNA